MSRTLIRVTAVASLVVTAACSQTPAPIDLKGQFTFAPGGANPASFAALKPAAGSYYDTRVAYKPSYQPSPVYSSAPKASPVVSQSTSQNAAVQSIGVSDLAPPSKPDGKPQAASTQPAKINQWTGRPHFSDTGPTPEKAKPAAQQAGAVSKTKGKPVKLEGASDESSGLMWPVSSKKVVSGFGPKGGGKVNEGINIASADGEPVWAAADGEVVYVGNELQGYGNMVIIKHAGTKTTTYAHLSAASVDKYDRVKQGDIIGYVGSTGNVTSPQLHFAVRNGRDPVDPQKYVSRNLAGL